MNQGWRTGLQGPLQNEADPCQGCGPLPWMSAENGSCFESESPWKLPTVMASQRGPRCRKVEQLRDEHEQTRNRHPASPLLKHMHSLAPLLSAPQSSRSNRISGIHVTVQIPGPHPKDPDPGSMEGLGICISAKCPGSPNAGALVHLALKMPLTGSASSGDEHS